MAKILIVGNITLDIVHQLAHYPGPDDEVRAEAQWQRRGGNGANSAAVLAQHGHQVCFAGTLGDDGFARVLLEDLASHRIDHRYCERIPGARTPLSAIILSRDSGSRSIVHFRDLPEYRVEAFAAIPLTDVDWFHFEGRNPPALAAMLARVREARIDQPISLEIEKPRPGIETLFPAADILVFSRAYAQAAGYANAPELLHAVRHRAGPGGLQVCSWDAEGAYALDTAGELLHAPATPVAQICDSSGAGDTFNAGLIHALLSGRPLPVALGYANALAAKKLQQYGDTELLV